jgi:hypothetical protein
LKHYRDYLLLLDWRKLWNDVEEMRRQPAASQAPAASKQPSPIDY